MMILKTFLWVITFYVHLFLIFSKKLINNLFFVGARMIVDMPAHLCGSALGVKYVQDTSDVAVQKIVKAKLAPGWTVRHLKCDNNREGDIRYYNIVDSHGVHRAMVRIQEKSNMGMLYPYSIEIGERIRAIYERQSAEEETQLTQSYYRLRAMLESQNEDRAAVSQELIDFAQAHPEFDKRISLLSHRMVMRI